MANFQTHITVSTVVGIGYATAGHFYFGLSIPHCMVAGALCSVAGMLPDLDHSSGIPLREMLAFVAVLIPMLMIPRFESLGMTPETMVFVAGLMYVFIRFFVGHMFRQYTTHRGMWHSIPAALIAGMLTFLICLSPDLNARMFKSWAVVLGFVSHLALDELYSVDFRGRRLKRSSGTALKFWGRKAWPNYSTYGKLALLTVLIFSDGPLMNYFGKAPLDIPWSAWVDDILDKPLIR